MSFGMRRRGWLATPILAGLLLVACGDDDGDGPADPGPDSGVDAGARDGSSPSIDAGLDANIDSSVPGADAASPFLPSVITAQISPGSDAFYGVTHDSAGNIYAAGKTLVSGDDYAVVVAKYSSAGVLDTAFGTNGYAIKNVIEASSSAANSQEQGRSVVVQASGKIVVAAHGEHQAYAADAGVGVLANDTDFYLVRFNTNGTLDPSFGSAGVVKLDVGTAAVEQVTSDAGVTPTLRGAESLWNVAQTPDGKLVIHGNTRNNAPSVDGGTRFDSDLVLARLSADGVLDTSFGTGGVVLTDFSNTSVSGRAATVLSNGSIVAASYSTNTVLGGTSAQNPVLYKVSADGTPDSNFAAGLESDPVLAPGIWHNYARSDQKNCEAYGAVPQGDKFVTLGYGPSPNPSSEGRDWVWFRFNANGTQDKSWGTKGETFQDPGGYTDNGHALITLPDNRVLGVGIGRLAPASKPASAADVPQEGMIGVLTTSGQPDTTFGPGGYRLLDFAGGRNDALWGVQLSPDKKTVVAVGEGANPTAQDDRDAIVVIFPVP